MATKTRNHEGFTKTMFKFLYYFVHLCVIVTSWQKSLENFFEYVFSHSLSKGGESRPRRDEGDDPLRIDLSQIFIK